MITGVQTRFSADVETLERRRKTSITIGGAGTIGSWVALVAAQLGFTLDLYDYDTVEIHNVGVQFFGHLQLNMKKTAALARNIAAFVGTTKITTHERFSKDSFVTPHVIAGFDNLPSRFLMYDSWRKLVTEPPQNINRDTWLYHPITGIKPLFIDTRINRGSYIIYPVTTNPESMRNYEEQVYGGDSQTLEPPCYDKTYAGVGQHLAGEISVLLAKMFRQDFTPPKQILYDYNSEQRTLTY